MGYLLRMSDEIRDWLAGLHDSDPVAAMKVGQALIALIGEGPSLGPPLAVSLADSRRHASLPDDLDYSYQDRLERMQIVRHSLADARGLAREMRQQITDLESHEAHLGDERRRALDAGRPEAAAEVAGELAAAQSQLAELRRLLPGVIEAEQEISKTSRRLQAWVDAFRTRKEVLKATYDAALAELGIHEAMTTSGQEVGDGTVPSEGHGNSGTEAVAKLQKVTAEIERELRYPDSVEGLTELRPGAPADSDIGILFAVEPPGTALLIAVLEGRDAVEDQHREAVVLSAEVLRRSRAGQAPEATAWAFDDAQSFLDEFFPGSAGEVEAGAAALVARNRASTLAEQRTRLGLTQAQVAQRMGVRQERVSAIERAEPGATEVRTLASYVDALGGRLEIIADIGEERVLLR